MSNIAIKGATTGTGTFTIESPATNTDRTLTLPDEAGTVLTGASDIESQVKTATNATGSAPIYACRAWVNFNGTGTVAINGSGNVSSITDNATGDYTANLTTAMPDGNGTVVGAAVESVGNFTGGQRAVMPSFSSTSAVRIGVTFQNGGTTDCPYVGVAIFR